MFYGTFIKNCIPTTLRPIYAPIGHKLEFYDFSEEELSAFYSKIGTNVKKFREKRGYTQMQLALAIGHNSVGHVAKAELNKYNKHFSLEQIYKIAKILQVAPSTLLH